MHLELPPALRDALERPDEATRSLLDGFGADAVAFFEERVHVLNTWGLESLGPFVGHHLWEAHRLNLADVATPDARGRVASTLSNSALLRGLLNRPTSPVRPERWSLPFNTVDQERFLEACAGAELSAIEAAISADPGIVHTHTKWGMNALYQTGAYGSDDSEQNQAATRRLLRAGAPGAHDALNGASWWGGEDAIAVLLDAGTAVWDSVRGTSALHYACMASRFNGMTPPEHFAGIAQALLDAGADPSRPDAFGWMPWAMAAGPVREVVGAAGGTKRAAPDGLDALWRSVEAGDRAALLSTDPDWLRLRKPEHGCTAVLRLVHLGHTPLAAELVGRRVHGPELDEAVALGLVDALPAAAARAGLRPPSTSGNPLPLCPLHHAAWFGQRRAARWLMDQGYSPGASHEADVAGHFFGPEELRQTTPLHLAVERGHLELVEDFVDRMDAHRGR